MLTKLYSSNIISFHSFYSDNSSEIDSGGDSHYICSGR